MKYDFSAQFLRILPPDTNFGEAWESLCFDLLRVEMNDPELIRMAPPDHGIDILCRKLCHAYQCKSDERGAFGSLSAAESIDSLETAWKDRKNLDWQSYCFCTNANYTGTALKKIGEVAKSIGLDSSSLSFKGPAYWDELCSRHFDVVANRLDYRVTATVKQVIDAFVAARYFDHYLKEFKEMIENAQFSIVVKNNRTPIEIAIPFSPDLTVKNCLDVTQQMLGISLDWTNFTDLGTSAGPSISLTIDRIGQGFSQKISDLPIKTGDKLELWIKIVWKDEMQKTAKDESTVLQCILFDRHCCRHVCDISTAILDRPELFRADMSRDERYRVTIKRAEELIQGMIWKSAKELRDSS